MKRIIIMVLFSLLSLSIVPEIIIDKRDNLKETSIILDVIEYNMGIKSALDLPIFSPVRSKDLIELTDLYGKRLVHPKTKKPSFHSGIDFSVIKNTKIYATADGIISEAERKGGYGKEIVIQHRNNYSTRYAHLNKILVNVGDSVQRSQLIALSGNTGITTGPHLHYEIVHYNVSINPMMFYFEWPISKHKQEYLKILKQLETFSFYAVWSGNDNK